MSVVNDWKPLTRQHVNGQSRHHKEVRKTYEDEMAGVFYTVSTSVLFHGAFPAADFLAIEQEHAEIELDCYRYAPLLGFAVPEKFTYAFHTEENTDNCKACFQSVLATKKIDGQDQYGVLDDERFHGQAKKSLLKEWALQTVALGLVLGDKDRAHPENIFFCKSSISDETKLVHVDFEDSRFYRAPDIADNILRESLVKLVYFMEEPLSCAAILERLTQTQEILLEQQTQLPPLVFDRFCNNLGRGIAETKKLLPAIRQLCPTLLVA